MEQRGQTSDQPELPEGEYRRIGLGPKGSQLQPGWPTPPLPTPSPTSAAPTDNEPVYEPPIKRRGTDSPAPDMLPSLPAGTMTGRNRLILGALGIVVLIALVAAVVHTTTPTSSLASNPAAIATTPAADDGSNPDAGAGTAAAATSDPNAPLVPSAPATTPPSPLPAQTVTYSCTGQAGDGVDITYGAEGSDIGAHHLPFSATEPLNTKAQYFNITAQLQGNGAVTCSTVVNWTDGSGNAQSVTQSGTASGGYNLASAEVCGDFEGGWQTC